MSNETEAPERIVLQPCPTYGWSHPDRIKHTGSWGVEYTRADLSDALVRAALREAFDATNSRYVDRIRNDPEAVAAIVAGVMEGK